MKTHSRKNRTSPINWLSYLDKVCLHQGTGSIDQTMTCRLYFTVPPKVAINGHQAWLFTRHCRMQPNMKTQ